MRRSVSTRKVRGVRVLHHSRTMHAFAGSGVDRFLAAAARLALAAVTIAACTSSPPASSAPRTTPPVTHAPSTLAPTAAPPTILPSASPGFAFDPESIVGYYESLGYACTDPQPSAQAEGFLYRSCVLTDSAGRTLTVGLVTDPADNVADAFMRVRGADSETILEPSAVLDGFAAFLGAILGEAHGTELLPWLAAHLGDTDARTTLGELSIATYTASPDDHSTLATEIANQAYLQAPRPSASPAPSAP